MDFTKELPAADVRLGPASHVRICGFVDITPPLVEMRLVWRGFDDTLRLTVEQAEAIASGLRKAVERARA